MMSLEREAPGAAIPLGMRPGRRELNEAHLIVSIPDAVPEKMRAQMREISELYVPPTSRNRKLATALMNFVCQEADANKMTLMLTASSFVNDEAEPLGLDDDQLVAWYKRFGFAELQPSTKGLIMARQVHRQPSHTIDRAVRLALVH